MISSANKRNALEENKNSDFGKIFGETTNEFSLKALV